MAAARRLVRLEDVSASPRLLLVERRNSSAWGRWIDNFVEVQEEAERWAFEHPAARNSMRFLWFSR